jgi:hypothetical protein
MYDFEHIVAWVMALAALLFMAIGLLRGFGVIGAEGDSFLPADTPGAPSQVHWLFGAVWLLAGLAASFLAMAFHRNDHHWLRDPEVLDDTDEALWKSEHLGAWVLALATLVFGAIGLLVGLDVFDRNFPEEGILWLVAANVTGILTNTLHSVRHHQMAHEEDYLVRMVERRVGTTTTGTTTTRPVVTEHDTNPLG